MPATYIGSRTLGVRQLTLPGRRTRRYAGDVARILHRARASFYDRQGPAAEVLQVVELPDPLPGPGEVRVRVRFSGVNPDDVKKREGIEGDALMPFSRVVPHNDGVGVIDIVGDGVDPTRIGRRVWTL